MVSGFASEFKDKRVDNMLRRHGYAHAKVFYSPIKIWLIFLLYFLVIGFTVILGAVYFLWTSYKIWLMGYIITAYLVAAFLNNSFAIAGNKFLVVNPNFPFNRVKEYLISDIKDIKLAPDPILTYAWLFGPLGNNYVQVLSKNGKNRYCCAGLDIDCYDENLTALNLDDLHAALKEKGISVRFEYE